MARYDVTDAADNDVFEIGLYLGAQRPRPDRGRFIAEITETYEQLADFQMLQQGRSRDERAPGQRSLAVVRYVVFYRIIEDGVRIMRVLHGARDIESELE